MRRRRIFINYRRDDSRADSGRLYDRLLTRFPNQVFRDVGSLEPGVEWHEAIGRVLSQVDACIVVIGKNWLDIKDSAGRRRLDNPNDTVRQEIAAALQRNVRVFPVLVGGSKMPDEEVLPPDLHPLCRRNALEITEQDWDEGYRKLVRALETSLGLPHEEGKRSSAKTWGVAAALGLAVLIMLIAAGVTTTSRGNRNEPNAVPNPSIADARTHPSVPETQSEREQPRRPAAVAPAQAPLRSMPGQSEVTGTWQAVVTERGQEIDEEVELYTDHSFRVKLQGSPVAVGRWRHDSGIAALEFTNSSNLLMNGTKFSCRLNAGVEDDEEFIGSCSDQMQNSWRVSMHRISENAPVSPSVIPRVNASALTMAERAVFAQILDQQYCTCPCGLNLLMCLEKDRSCPYSPTLATTALAAFLAMTRS